MPSAPIAPSAPPARLQTMPVIVHSPFSPLKCSQTAGTITPIRKYAKPTHTNGRNRADFAGHRRHADLPPLQHRPIHAPTENRECDGSGEQQFIAHNWRSWLECVFAVGVGGNAEKRTIQAYIANRQGSREYTAFANT